MKKNAKPLSREELIQRAGGASLATLLASAAAAAPRRTDASGVDQFSGPWNLSLSRVSTPPKNVTGRAKRKSVRKLDPSDQPTPVDLMLVFHSLDDIFIPDGYYAYATYYVGLGSNDQPVYIYGYDENGNKEDDGHGHSRQLKSAFYVVMCTT